METQRKSAAVIAQTKLLHKHPPVEADHDFNNDASKFSTLTHLNSQS